MPLQRTEQWEDNIRNPFFSWCSPPLGSWGGHQSLCSNVGKGNRIRSQAGWSKIQWRESQLMWGICFLLISRSTGRPREALSPSPAALSLPAPNIIYRDPSAGLWWNCQSCTSNLRPRKYSAVFSQPYEQPHLLISLLETSEHTSSRHPQQSFQPHICTQLFSSEVLHCSQSVFSLDRHSGSPRTQKMVIFPFHYLGKQT